MTALIYLDEINGSQSHQKFLYAWQEFNENQKRPPNLPDTENFQKLINFLQVVGLF